MAPERPSKNHIKKEAYSPSNRTPRNICPDSKHISSKSRNSPPPQSNLPSPAPTPPNGLRPPYQLPTPQAPSFSFSYLDNNKISYSDIDGELQIESLVITHIWSQNQTTNNLSAPPVSGETLSPSSLLHYLNEINYKDIEGVIQTERPEITYMWSIHQNQIFVNIPNQSAAP